MSCQCGCSCGKWHWYLVGTCVFIYAALFFLAHKVSVNERSMQAEINELKSRVSCLETR